MNKDEGCVTTCPDCGETAVVTDSGLVCTNTDCENS